MKASATHRRRYSFRGLGQGYIQDLTTYLPPAMLTSHALVLLAIARNPTIRVRDVAALLGISERRVYNIIDELVDRSLLSVKRERRQKIYDIDRTAMLTLPVIGRMTLGDLLNGLAPRSLV